MLPFAISASKQPQAESEGREVNQRPPIAKPLEWGDWIGDNNKALLSKCRKYLIEKFRNGFFVSIMRWGDWENYTGSTIEEEAKDACELEHEACLESEINPAYLEYVEALENRVAELEAMFKEPEAYMVHCSKGEYDAMVFTELQSARYFADSELDDMPESVEYVPIYPLYAGKELELEAELKRRG